MCERREPAAERQRGRERGRDWVRRSGELLFPEIERERERVEREAHEARMKAEAETRAAEVAKKQAVAEALQSRMNKSSKSSKSEKKAAPVSAGSSFSSLLDQINNERERLNNQANEKQNQEWDSLGRSIEDIIDKAINSQNYRELSRNITSTIDKAARTGSDALWRALDMSGATKPRKTITVEPVRPEPVQKTNLPALYGSANGETAKGILKTVFGGSIYL